MKYLNHPVSKNMKPFLIRQASEKDLEAIANLYAGTVRNVNSKDYSKKQIDVWSASGYDLENWKKKIHEQYFLVAVTENKITGFASIARNGYIDYMYIHKDYQRCGIAKKLLEKIEEKGMEQKNKEVYAYVSTTAKGFFERAGYKYSGDEFNSCGGVDFVNSIMTKNLFV